MEQPRNARPAQLSCGHCIRHPPAFTHTYAPLRYEFPVDLLIQRFKQRADYHSIELFSRLFAQQLPLATPEHPLPQQLIPVPLHLKRLRQRGFNQSLELAHSIGQRLNIGTNAGACSRVLDTPHQQGLSAKQRRRNLRHAFSVNAEQLDLSGYRHVALIDDVMTTGSTAQVLAKALRRAGIEQVDIWCLARTAADRHRSDLRE
ncbi:MAG: ComF family protein [Motiliproteus sp.]